MITIYWNIERGISRAKNQPDLTGDICPLMVPLTRPAPKMQQSMSIV